MRQPTSSTRYRAGIAALAIAVTATGMAGIGMIAAQAAPRAAAPGDLLPGGILPTGSASPTSSPTATSTASPTATSTASSTASPSPSSSCPLPIPLPGVCDTSSSSASPSTSPSSSPSATPTTSPSARSQPPTIYFNHQKRTKHHLTRLIIRVVANGSLVTDLTHVHLRHCDWNLGSAHAKHYNGGRQKLWIAITRRHQHTKGSESFYVVDAAGQRTLVKARV